MALLLGDYPAVSIVAESKVEVLMVAHQALVESLVNDPKLCGRMFKVRTAPRARVKHTHTQSLQRRRAGRAAARMRVHRCAMTAWKARARWAARGGPRGSAAWAVVEAALGCP
eukprot:5127631-Prymnesium_polylepis.1